MGLITANWASAAALAGGIVLFGATAVLVLIAARMARYRAEGSSAGNSMDAEAFSLARYEPMLRLTREDDSDFLASLAGYRPEIGAKFRRDRRRIFRMYLRHLAADFHRLHAAARKLVADSPERHSDLVGVLIRCQLTFWRRMALIELRLLAPAARLPQIDLTPLLRPMELMQMYISEV